jgi:hypothetical protein
MPIVPPKAMSRQQQLNRAGLFGGYKFYIHSNIEGSPAVAQLRQLLMVRSVSQYSAALALSVLGLWCCAFAGIPEGVVPSLGQRPDAANQLSVSDVIQRFARRTKNSLDRQWGRRRPVVQSQWVHECVNLGRLVRYDAGWEVM